LWSKKQLYRTFRRPRVNDAKLESAQEALTAKNEGHIDTAVNKLNAFINEVEAQRGNKLTTSQADELHAFGTNLIKLLQGDTQF
jgi:ABC-type transporter Mla subunit MlaD